MPTDTPVRGAVYVYSVSTLSVRSTIAIQLVKHPDAQPTITLEPENGIASEVLQQGIYKVLPAPLPADVILDVGPGAETAIFSVKDPPPRPHLVEEFTRIFGDPPTILNRFFPALPRAKGEQPPFPDEEPTSPPAAARRT